ncbi:unnamed protein product [Moneuplotes crassus]|uniref:Uncharacterized protein n=1 Tax=Euplotes crassus TaxID=5936 RepID=A0AAD1XPP0_EUPCR|nr:unnamed protein product [Moneuplotes crassus]
MNNTPQKRTYQELSKSMKMTESKIIMNAETIKKDTDLLKSLCKNRKQSASNYELEAGFKPETSRIDQKTQASSASGLSSLHGSPVLKALEIEDGDQALDPIIEIPVTTNRKAPLSQLGSQKTYRPYFCISSFKVAPKPSELPSLPF